MIEFKPFLKIARLSRHCVVTEKIDGTNAQIWIDELSQKIMAGSRNHWLTISNDNFGFANWVEANKEELLKLGPGVHFGEWWGAGIQRGYNIKDKRFSLFNTSRWSDDNVRPKCCHVVPVLWEGVFEYSLPIYPILAELIEYGSKTAPGFMDPEGIVIYHEASKQMFKKTIKNDEKSKGQE